MEDRPEGARGKPDTVLGVLRAASEWLTARRVDAPRRSAELLMAQVLNLSRLELYLAHDRPLSTAELERLRPLVAERGRHVPLAYLLGDWEFFGLEFEVSPAVLVPRPETEHLVELAIECAPVGACGVELGTGSGAIAVALAKARPDLRIIATELSGPAAAIARRNVRRHGVGDRVTLVRGDWWQPLAPAGFDLLVSNPPYVDPNRPDLIAADVREFEPAVALFTPPGDPGAAYRAIAAGAGEHLRGGAWILLETGEGASAAGLAALQAEPSLTQLELRDDLAGRPRYLCGRRAPS